MASNPFELWMSAFSAPLSGDVTQEIDPRFFSPNLTFEFAGDQRVEGRIVSRVASYGRQLDTLIAAVQALSEATGTDLPDLSDLAERIAAEKSANREDLARAARESLATLRRADPDLYAQVLSEARPPVDAAPS